MSRHLSSLEVDVWFADGKQDGEIAEHVASCARCSAYVAELQTLSAQDLGAHLPITLTSRRSRLRRLAPAVTTLALAAALALYAKSRAVSEATDYVGVKGAPAVEVLVRSDGGTRIWDGHTPVHAGDALALRVACEHLRQVTVATESPTGIARLADVPCLPAAPALPFTLVVDEEPGNERFSVVLTAAHVDDSKLRTLVQAKTHDRDAGHGIRDPEGRPSMNRALLLVVATITLCLAGPARALDTPRSIRRVAVIVGANAPAPGRQALRYAHTDAQLMADVLERVGRFAKPDIQVLLEPHPVDVLAALDRAARDVQSAGGDSLLVFYYSGHSDGQELFPHGESLALSELRDRVARSTARVRVAILDTCRGGSWTRTKGLTVGPALDAVDLMNVATEGTALLSSSSGLENAHKAAALNGSFFTHHVAAGLLGAADKSGDGSVTLQEVFEYAKERTVRDSARMAVTTQHPSFDMQLRGRQDIVLAQMASSSSALEVAQTNALEVIHLGSGVTVAETPPGRQQLRLALVPGRYLVRRIADGRVYSKDIDVRPGATVLLDEGQLVATGSEKLAMKDASTIRSPFSAKSTMPKNWWEIRLGLGTSTGSSPVAAQLYDPNSSNRLERTVTGVWSFTYGITDRLSWSVPLPAFAYRFGDAGTFELIARGGLVSFAYASRFGMLGTLDAGFATRTWLTRDLSLVSDASIDHEVHVRTERSGGGALPRDYLSLRASGGIAWNAGERMTLALGAGLTGDVALQRSSLALPASTSPAGMHQPGSTAFVVGSVQCLGHRPLPLVQIHLSRRFSLDGYASLGFDLRGGPLRDRYLAGFTVAF